MADGSHFEVYPERAYQPASMDRGTHSLQPTGQYRWRFRAANGQISAVAGEGFTRREDAKRAVSDLVLAVRGSTYGQRFPEAIQAAVIDVDD